MPGGPGVKFFRVLNFEPWRVKLEELAVVCPFGLYSSGQISEGVQRF